MTDDRKEFYNKYDGFEQISYNCTKYLLNNNELIWKLLKYSDNNAWRDDIDHPNLTSEEKGYLINDGSPDPDHERFRVFFDVGQDDSWTGEACILRITPIELIPKNYIYGNVAIAFEVYCHYKMNTLSNYSTRLNTIVQQLISSFNGQEIGLLGRLYFDAKASARCRMSISGQVPFKGNAIIMCNWMA